MIKKFFRKIKNFLFSSKRIYLRYLKREVCDNQILLEAGQGKNVMGNMFAFLKEIEWQQEWADVIPFFVVTSGTENKAKKLFSQYKFKKVQIIYRDSREYMKKLATCKYLVTDNSFPPYFQKRDSQIYLNTWHGTPLKHLGRSDINNASSLGNIQKNYFSCDYALFPNEHTKDVFMKDYMLDKMFQGNILMADYPRNAVFCDKNMRKQVRRELSLTDKTVLAYMPTWRGTGRTAESIAQIQIISEQLEAIDKQLKENQILFVNLHFLVSKALNFSLYKHIKPFPDQYETYDFLNICDILITDYSSVIFDFAITGKKIILFAYDKEEYIRTKGMYIDFEKLPFPLVEDVNGLIDEINCSTMNSYEEFINRYCKYANKDTTKKILTLLIHGDKQDLDIRRVETNQKEKVVCHAGSLKAKSAQFMLTEKLKEFDYSKQDIMIVFEDGLNIEKSLFLKQLPREVYYYSLVKTEVKSIFETLFKYFFIRWNLFEKQLKKYFEREKKRLFPNWEPDDIKVYFFRNPKYVYIYDQFKNYKEYHHFPYDCIGYCAFNNWFIKAESFMTKHYQHIVSYDEDYMHTELGEIKKYSGDTKIVLHSVHTKKVTNALDVKLNITLFSFHMLDVSHLRVCVGNLTYIPSLCLRLKKADPYNIWEGNCEFLVPFKDSNKQEIQNKISLIIADEDGNEIRVKFSYGRFLKFRDRFIGYKPYFDKTQQLTMFFRYPKDTLTLTIREQNVTDSRKERVKVVLAFIVSKICFLWKPILLFEKNSERYEESASVVYEKLIDMGYKNAYFILNKDYEFKNQIAKKYQKNIIDKYSFSHYLCFFCAKTFIGSESQYHSFELRPISKLVIRKLTKSPHNYVFLQHGVMYMISLDSEQRSFFQESKNKKIKERVVVSSELEAKHFVEQGGRSRNSLYLCGLPKYDRNIWNDSADKVVIMLTWRPWEYVQSLSDLEETTYFRMLKTIVEHIPKQYYDRLLVLPHPLVEKQMREKENELSQFIPMSIKYDDILKETKVLITDYSSISYDAFYRGANIIFCWEEKDETVSHYGQHAKLMLTPELAFGDLNYDYNKLAYQVEQAYLAGQKGQYLNNYSAIVSFHDGHNTDRLIQMMQDDDMI